MRILAAIPALLLCHGAMAQPFKCLDASGKITYSSMSCSDLGLKDAGEVKDRVQVTPALRAPARPPARAAQDESTAKPAAAEEAAKPERRCFTVRNAKGATVTRCNDKPDEDSQ
jgi:hypothetical protein